jgi:hypothetical protein
MVPARSRSERIFDRTLALAAALLLGSMLAAALHDVSRAWDVWYYHMPFAARLAGIVREDAYVFHAMNQARFEGYPLLAERVQGLLWRITGHPETANLVAFASVPAMAVFLRVRFAVPWYTTVLGLMAVPLVHLHATSRMSIFQRTPLSRCSSSSRSRPTQRANLRTARAFSSRWARPRSR